jgi:hypothetical protein
MSIHPEIERLSVENKGYLEELVQLRMEVVALVRSNYEKKTEIERLRAALEGMIAEWDKLSRYGSPMAKSANEQIAFARAALEGKP